MTTYPQFTRINNASFFIVSSIQSTYKNTLVQTLGKSGLAQPIPKPVIPCKTGFSVGDKQANGPPLSPWQESTPPSKNLLKTLK